MTEYINMWKNYINFSDRTTVRGYWMAYLFNFIAAIVISVLTRFIPIFAIVSIIYSLAIIVPSLAMCVRRLRDAGLEWVNIFWVFVPLAGVIILIIKLVKPSVADDGTPVV